MASGEPSLNRPTAGKWARQVLGDKIRQNISDIKSLFRGRNTESATLSDTNKTGLNDGDAVNKVATIVNTDDNTSAVVHLQGGGNAVSILAQSGSTFGTTEGNDGTTNVYWDIGNSRYELENQKGGERTYEITYEGA